MYPCSTTSSSSCQSQNSTISESGLTRYGSAPGSLLRTAVDAVIPGGPVAAGVGGHYFTATGESSESPCKVNNSSPSTDPKEQHHKGGGGLQRSYGFQEALGGGGGSSSLIRQRSSPAVFLNHLATSAHLHDNNNNNNSGFTITRVSGSSYSPTVVSNSGHGHGVARLKSQLSFTGQESLTQISEVSESESESAAADHRLPYGHGHGHGPSSSSSTFAMDPWDSSNSNSIVFSANKRPKNIDGDILNCLTALDSQFGLPQTSLEMATMDKLMHIPEDSVPCKIRAKRGCATHPRSIAERERRTRISGKLKKLQELVPNMDKQTSYADMLDLAVQHIKGLQGQVQKLHNELENCTCGCKPST